MQIQEQIKPCVEKRGHFKGTCIQHKANNSSKGNVLDANFVYKDTINHVLGVLF